MCYEVECDKCRKSTWGGCGRHVARVYQQIPEGQSCSCREWAGVKLNSEAAAGGLSPGDAGEALQEPQSLNGCTVM